MTNRKISIITFISFLCIFAFYVKQERGFEYLKRLSSDLYFFKNLSRLDDFKRNIINIPLQINGLTDIQVLNLMIDRDSDFFSQRLIIGLNNYYSFDYILHRLFNKSIKLDLDDKGVFLLNQLTKKLEYGFGGVHLSSTALASFKDLKVFNGFIDKLSEICTVERKFQFLDSQVTLIVKPQFYCDYNFFGEGINYEHIINYKNFETNNLDSNIYFMNIDGIFGPILDYSERLIENKFEIINKSGSFDKSGIKIFPKHFGYRKEVFLDNKKNSNTHISSVVLKTPMEVFKKNDISLYDLIINRTKFSGIMIGHHILGALDNQFIASASKKVIDFINDRYTNNLITISDSINMHAFKISHNNNVSLYDYVKTDLILLTDIYNYKIESIMNKGKDKRVLSLKKILHEKHSRGNVIISRLNSHH